MRTEEAVREMYQRYVFGCAKSRLSDEGDDAALIYYGAAIACGRTLGKDMKRIRKDLEVAEDHYRKVGI